MNKMVASSFFQNAATGFGAILALLIIFQHAKLCRSQTTTWPQADQEACIQQCMTTGVNCSSGCGIPADCAVGWRGQIKRRCYTIRFPTMPGYTWSQAQSACQANGSELASVHSEMENSFLVGLIVNTINPDGKNHNFWLGNQLTRNAAGSVTGSSWSDQSAVDYGDPVANRGVYPWATGQPVNAGNCVRMMGFGPYRGLWFDANCNQATNLVPTIGYFCKGCPGGWTAWNGRCYKAFVSATQQGTFVNFQRLCSMFNSSMVSIHSAAENNFVFNLAKTADPTIGGFMIGLQLSRDSNGYVNGMTWSDGSPVDFGWNAAGGVYPWADTGSGWFNQPDSPGWDTMVRVAVTASAEPGRWDDLNIAYPLQGTVCRF